MDCSLDLMKNLVISFDDIVVGGCVGVSSQVNTESKSYGEYLSGNSYAVEKEKTNYMVTLTFQGNHTVYPESDFQLKLQQSNYVVVYYNCKVLGEREYTQNGFVFRELIISSGERRSYNE